ncbi:hypothetical protein Hanom_Chr11g00998341 [Helianthus anomalus]
MSSIKITLTSSTESLQVTKPNSQLLSCSSCSIYTFIKLKGNYYSVYTFISVPNHFHLHVVWLEHQPKLMCH